MSQTVHDPGIERGPFRVYNRTDGRACVIDRRMWLTSAWAAAAIVVTETTSQAVQRAGELAAAVEAEAEAGGGA